MSQIYIKRDRNKRIVLISTKVRDCILLAGRIPNLNQFAEQIAAKYKVRKTIIDDKINFNGCTISQDNLRNIRMDMTEFLSKLSLIKMDKTTGRVSN